MGFFRNVKEVENFRKAYGENKADGTGFDIVQNADPFPFGVLQECGRNNFAVLYADKALVMLHIGSDMDSVQLFQIRKICFGLLKCAQKSKIEERVVAE